MHKTCHQHCTPTNGKNKPAHQRACGIQRVRKHEANQPGVHASRNERSDGEHGGKEDYRRADELEADSEPAVHGNTGQVAHLVAVDALLVGRDKNGLL